MMTETVHVKGKDVSISYEDMTVLDLKDLTRIDYGNLRGDQETFSESFTQVALLRAQASSEMQELKIKLELTFAEEEPRQRDLLITEDAKGNKKHPTVGQVDGAVKKSQTYRAVQNEYNQAYKAFEIMDALYWGMKEKSRILDKLGFQALDPDRLEKSSSISKDYFNF